MTGVWAELMDDAEIARALPALADLGLYVAVALPVSRIGDSSFANLTRRAADLGVPVRAWPLLERDQGYWINETNVARASDAIDALLAWRARDGGPKIDGISFDLEPAFEYAESLRRVARERPFAIFDTLLAHVDPRSFVDARDALARTVERVRRAGLCSHAVAIPTLLDQTEIDDVLEDAFDTPLGGIDWDEISFMVYQTVFQQMIGTWLGPSLVYSYARSAVERYGERAGIDLGIVGNEGLGVDPGGRYRDPETLRDDVRAALAAGVSLDRVRVYGLKGAISSSGVVEWLDFSKLGARAPVEDRRAVDGLRNAARALVTALRVAVPMRRSAG